MGICGTDIQYLPQRHMSTFPLIPCHEFHGRVVEVGKQVTTLRVGDHVAVETQPRSVRKCSRCRTKQFVQRSNLSVVGVTA
ncbi:MAG UNVERIFIED_CONTAM: alcohol dehydrogenase catalytic domain-containing protein [Anaerolineae bacterium]|jgi:D-arabinose 1-dehydrogenase-like Zn-dependent alcohol dehydrogenase